MTQRATNRQPMLSRYMYQTQSFIPAFEGIVQLDSTMLSFYIHSSSVYAYTHRYGEGFAHIHTHYPLNSAGYTILRVWGT